jgi:hypothetical protein
MHFDLEEDKEEKRKEENYEGEDDLWVKRGSG